jgi:hypothetical protein
MLFISHSAPLIPQLIVKQLQIKEPYVVFSSLCAWYQFYILQVTWAQKYVLDGSGHGGTCL